MKSPTMPLTPDPTQPDTLRYALSTKGFEPEHYLLGREALLEAPCGFFCACS
jgi:hypothetical protein